MKRRNKRNAILIALTMTALLAACGNSGSSSGADKNETYSYVFGTDPDTFDYSVTSRTTNTDHLANFEEPLMKTNRYGQIVPGLAQSYKVTNGGKTYTYKLRKDAKWVDSEGNTYAKVKPQDFITGIKHDVAGKSEGLYVIQNSIVGLNDYASGKTKDFSKVGVKVVGKDKIRFNLTQPEPYWNSKLQYGLLEPINGKFLKQQGKKYGQPKASAILYDGPYRLTNFTSKSVIEYTANDKYWDKKNVHVKHVKYTFNDGSNPDALYKSFEKGDYTQARVYPNLPGYKQVQKQNGKNIVWSRQDAGTFNITMNLNRQSYNNTDKKTAKQREDTRKALLNQDFRLAIQYAMDRTAYNAQATGGAGAKRSLRNEMTPPSFVQADGKDYGTYVQADLRALNPAVYGKIKMADAQDGTYNPALAKRLFAKAKTALTAQGVSFPIKLDFPQGQKSELGLNEVKSFKRSEETTLGAKNVEIDIIELNADRYNAATYAATTGKASDFDLSNASGWSPDYQDPSTYLDIYKPSNGSFLIGYGLDPASTRSQSNEATQNSIIKEVGLDKYESLVNAAEKITNDDNARYKAFAKAEAYLLSIGIMIPVNSGGGAPSVTKVQPFTTSYSWTGAASARLDYMKLQSKPVTTSQYNKAMAAWTKKRAEIAKNND